MNPTNSPTLKLGQEAEVTVASLSHGGSGVARYNDFVLFIPFAAPGDVVRVLITDLKKNYAEAELLEIIKPSCFRTPPPCPVFGICGGCQWQHVQYEEQLKQKQLIVEHALHRIAKEENVVIDPVVPSPKPFHYRNRIQIRTEGPRAGFYKRRSHDLVEFDECHITEETLNDELAKIKKEIADQPATKISKIEIGLTGDASHPRVYRSANKSHGEELGFSQVNTLQNARMQNYVCEAAGKPEKVATDNVGFEGNLLDLYCGAGNFSFPLNKSGWRIYGVDNSRPAISAARAHANPMTFFSAADGSLEVKRLAEKNRRFQAILIDPPRIGADERLWANLEKLRPETLIYVSCNPATFARDWARFKKKSPMKLVSLRPFDMFPQTFHVELVAVAKRM